MFLQSEKVHTAVFRDKVTSPEGTTIAGLLAMERRAFRAAGTHSFLMVEGCTGLLSKDRKRVSVRRCSGCGTVPSFDLCLSDNTRCLLVCGAQLPKP